VDRLDALLEDAVRRQLVADVPVGVLLSGGIDSSLVTAMAARVSSAAVRTFTISFPGHGAFDEGPYARQVASHFGTAHTELVAEPASVELLPTLARQYDEPMADSSMVPTYLVSRLIRQHATVALGGDGGDELFGGYTPYGWLLKQERARRFIPKFVRAGTAGAVSKVMPVGVRGRNYLMGYGGDFAESSMFSRILMDEQLRARLLAPVLGRIGRRLPPPEGFHRALGGECSSPVRTMTAMDFLSYMPDDILVKVDRASMLSSLEVRAPWLDHRLIEFAFGEVPDSLRATTAARKILPRRLAQRLLPAALDLQRKQGFSLPLASWFRGSWGKFFEEVLGDASTDLFDRRTVLQLVEGQRRGRSNTNRLFALTMFELWRREYGASVP
jgi:asparagine synthase (glutamine-hydrolysing)